MRIAHISAVCRNIDNADKFYRDLLGFAKSKDFSIGAELTDKIFAISCSCRILVYAREGAEVEVFIPEFFPEKKNPFEHVCLEVGDKESFLARCQKAGVHVKKIAKGEKYLTFIEDFDGNLFEIKERGQA